MYLERLAAGVDPGDFGPYLVVVDGEAIGGIGFHGAPDADGCVEIGYGIVPSRRGAGHATAALRLLVDRAAELGARLLVAETEPDNAASSAVLRHGGFGCVDAEQSVTRLSEAKSSAGLRPEGGEGTIRFERPLR